MVKKIASYLIIAVFLLTGLAFAAGLPAPFEKAKDYALAGGLIPGTPVYASEFVGVEDQLGWEFHFMFIYNPENGIVAIMGQSHNLELTAVRVLTDEEGVLHFEQLIFTPFGMVSQEIDQDTATQLAFAIFAEAVRIGLL